MCWEWGEESEAGESGSAYLCPGAKLGQELCHQSEPVGPAQSKGELLGENSHDIMIVIGQGVKVLN